MYAKVVLAGLLATLTHAGVLEPQYSAAAPSSVQYISHPVASAPVQYTPAPVQYAPAPVQYDPAPVQYAPAPVRYAPAPVQYAAAPVKYSVQPVAPLAQPVVSNYVKTAPIQYAAQPVAPVAQRVPVSEDYNYDPNPQYEYGYDIQDGLTGDSKSQSETRQGDVVKGSYSVIDPDGHKRTVEYTADPVNGFNAVVTREPIHVKAVAPVQYAAKVPVASLYKQ